MVSSRSPGRDNDDGSATPNASRAMALLGNTTDAYDRTWHLPVDPDRRTYPSSSTSRRRRRAATLGEFATRFPDFAVTTYRQGVAELLRG